MARANDLHFGAPSSGWPSFCVECGLKCTEPPLCEGCTDKLVEFLTFDATDVHTCHDACPCHGVR